MFVHEFHRVSYFNRVPLGGARLSTWLSMSRRYTGSSSFSSWFHKGSFNVQLLKVSDKFVARVQIFHKRGDIPWNGFVCSASFG